MGGFGAAVLEALDRLSLSIPVIRIGWPDQFIEHGKVDELRQRYGLTAAAALEQLRPLLAKRGAGAASSKPGIAREVHEPEAVAPKDFGRRRAG